MHTHRRVLRAVLALALTSAAGLSSGPPAASAAPRPDDPKAPAPAPDLVPVERFFHGKITKVDGNFVEILYDFSDPTQLRDFEPGLPFRAIRTVEYAITRAGRCEIKGTGSMKHRAVFLGEAGLTATVTPRKARDIGFAITEQRESEVFTLYCLYDKHFSAGDNVFVPQNMIIKFIPRDPKVNKDGVQDWRYCGSRGQKPEIRTATAYKVEIGRGDNESRMTITAPDGEDFKSAGKEWDRDLTSMIVGAYAHDSHFEVDDFTVRGKLSPEFVAKEHLDLTTWKPAAEAAPAPAPAPGPAATGDADPNSLRARRTIDGYPLDTKPAILAALLRDTLVPIHLRTEAAEKAKSAGLKRIVPFLVDGLQSADLDARKLSFDVLKTLTGKSFNFRPEGAEDARRKAVRDLNDHIAKNAAEYQ